jgi:nucleotide-binding universal stress UspA family protein
MYKLNHILVCLDLTEMDDSLIRYTRFLVNQINPDSITFLHVMRPYDIPKELMDTFPELDEPVPEIIREELQEKINEQCHSGTDVNIRVEVKEGAPIETIVKFAQKNNITLTLMGKKVAYQGNAGIVKKVLGIIPSSVLLVCESGYERIENLLVRMDFTKASEMALEMAFRLKELTGANIACHHTHKLPVGYFPQVNPDKDEKLQKYVEKVSKKAFEKFKKNLKYNTDDLAFSFSIDTENEEDLILYRQALTTGADMIVIGSNLKSDLADIVMDVSPEKLAAPNKNIPVFIVNDRSKAMVFLKRIFQ